jgi:hypothetical protein
LKSSSSIVLVVFAAACLARAASAQTWTSVFGHCHAQKGDATRAEPLLQTGYEKLNANSPPTDPNRITSLEYMVRFYTEAGRGSDRARLREELDKVNH